MTQLPAFRRRNRNDPDWHRTRHGDFGEVLPKLIDDPIDGEIQEFKQTLKSLARPTIQDEYVRQEMVMHFHLFGHIVGHVVVERPNLDLCMRFERLEREGRAKSAVKWEVAGRNIGVWSTTRYVESSVFIDDVQSIQREQRGTNGDESAIRRARGSEVRLQLFEDCLMPFTQSAYKAMLFKRAREVIKYRELRVLLGFLRYPAAKVTDMEFKDELVERRPEVKQEIAKYDDPRVTVKLLDFSDVEAICSSITINLAGNRVTIEKGTSGNFVPEVVLMIPCSLQLEDWAVEASTHATP